MNISQIKENYTCFDILGEPVKRGGRSWMYRCPWRTDRHPSLAVSNNGKGWKDWATGESGNVIDLIAKIIDNENLSAICAWVDSFFLSPAKPLPKEIDSGKEKQNASYTLPPLSSSALLAYLDQRCIPREIATRYLREIHWPNPNVPGRYLFGLAYPTDKGGIMMRNLRFKRVFGAGGITTHFLAENRSTAIFEGFFDMLSWVAMTGGVQKSNFIVLNSVANRAAAIAKLRNGFPADTLYLCLDNDPAGDAATADFLVAFPDAQDMRKFYKNVKDINDLLMTKKQRKE